MNSLGQSLAGHQVEVQTYHPGIEFNYQDKDLIILSGGGGEGLEIHDYQDSGKLWYEDEMNLVKTADKPIIGICMGFEVIARAYGAPITQVGQLVQGPTDLQVSEDGLAVLGQKTLRQHESHRWRVEDVPSDFEVLATSKTGIEVFRYKNLFATQFHPEKGGSIELSSLHKQKSLTRQTV